MSETSTTLAAILTTDRRVVDANPALIDLLGPARADVIGTPFSSFLSPELRGMDVFGEHDQDLRGRRTDGLPWCATLSTWRPPAGGSIVMHGVRRFGPVSWWTEEATLQPPKGAGVDTVVSHDIRGALRGASGFVSVVRRAADDPQIAVLHERLSKVGEHLAIAARSLATADETAERVVDYLRWGTRRLAVRRLAMEPVVRQAVELSAERFSGPPAHIGCGALPDVVADPELVRWAIAELITNARKFSERPVTVAIELAGEHDGFCDIRVRDDGIGIDALLFEDAFLPGRKLQARGDYGGVGMGLALCRLVFERHAGWCRIETTGESGEGTTIRCRLPSSSAGTGR